MARPKSGGEELDSSVATMEPGGLLLWIAAQSEEEQQALLLKIERWS